jgi:hypothetical protein
MDVRCRQETLRQIAECYKSVGREPTTVDTQNVAPYSRVRGALSEILRLGGVALTFGWQSSGLGRAWETRESLRVQHGGAQNDGICVAQRRPERVYARTERIKAGVYRHQND